MTTQPWSIGVITTSRADFGIYRSVLEALAAAPDMDYGLFVSGMHLSPEFGLTAKLVEESGHPVWDNVEGLMSSDSEVGIAKSMGLTTLGFADAFARRRPDALIILGDRFEMHAAALAALPFRIPLAHIHGGEETEGAIDNVLRHSLTKLSNIHFPATELSARRIRAMGEGADRVVVSGAPALDGLEKIPFLSRDELARRFNLPEVGPFILATYHPVTLEPERSFAELDALWQAVRDDPEPIVFTRANADTAGRAVNQKLEAFVSERPDRTYLVGTMGAQGYFSAMRAASVMVGNSSSGILEAASFDLPVVNIGDRQSGRERSTNVIDVNGDEAAIRAALAEARSPTLQARAKASKNVYGDGNAASRIVAGLRTFLEADHGVAKAFSLSEGQ
ncbi:MAG: UDP-N-acetylglucosamine 2-epimerase (hydrolyzing) [Alphaproteobacteria bacterium]|nr:UDP-N-acetylglucosamine 2-epimerase (hydrolyzing) [Alphaproteobacteria bacterium]